MAEQAWLRSSDHRSSLNARGHRIPPSDSLSSPPLKYKTPSAMSAAQCSRFSENGRWMVRVKLPLWEPWHARTSSGTPIVVRWRVASAKPLLSLCGR